MEGGIIYKITNQINRKVYIGKTIQSLDRRLRQHFSDAKRGKKTFLMDAIRKCGENNFRIEIIKKFHNRKNLLEREKFYIAKYKSNAIRYSNPSFGYN